MHLSEYIEKNAINIAGWSRKLNLNPGTIHNAIKGVDMHLSVAFKIVQATKGDVTFHDLFYSISTHDNENPYKRNKKDKAKDADPSV